ncbi:hypothetical protein IVB45_25435 [Bradyrhizobium sp. 4]|uniref:hypothetical protein n=1 Tax=unclassified Bradyrhizobium TaxID=2631580 RepID=UPI001FF825D5|nr:MULTISPECIES: hypothetical protein [unclassified Bradyrhizobium]MCK1396971.1 hypothetical protein [Bradyrhizobium sp. 39]MCK1747905.1 hypothetical protein [Bradyrhizobium sp. 135]UPJ33276.1 hypothetical protein IVB45_25435 [Bradyrhizobium sp. 4]
MSGKIIGLVVENVPVLASDTQGTFAIQIITEEALNLLPKLGLLGQGIGNVRSTILL